jgi:hypothetical protein
VFTDINGNEITEEALKLKGSIVKSNDGRWYRYKDFQKSSSKKSLVQFDFYDMVFLNFL